MKKKADAILLATALFVLSGVVVTYNIKTVEGGELAVSLSELINYGSDNVLSSYTRDLLTADEVIEVSAIIPDQTLNDGSSDGDKPVGSSGSVGSSSSSSSGGSGVDGSVGSSGSSSSSGSGSSGGSSGSSGSGGSGGSGHRELLPPIVTRPQ